MTTPLPTPSAAEPAAPQALRSEGRHLRVVPPLVSYLLLVPEGTDPAELLSVGATGAQIHPLVPLDESPAEAPTAPSATAGTPTTGIPTTADAPALPGTPDPQEPPTPAAAADRGLHIDDAARTVQVDGRHLDLTYLEFELLAQLVAHPQRVHSREQLVGSIWGYDHIGDGRTIDVHIARLRRKLGPSYRDRIVTVRRVGYRYVPGRA